MNQKFQHQHAIGLLKSSTPEQIKVYFQKIFEVKQSGEEFPVDLDQVWPLVYQRKDYAIKELRKNFIENDDYEALRQKAERKSLGTNDRISYHLSLSCLEYFIVRKMRPVFEIYRQVFHKAIETGLIKQVKPIAGILPVVCNGHIGYPRKEVYLAAGYSYPTGSTSLYKKRYPNEHFNIYRTSCVSANFAMSLITKGTARQLTLFNFPLALSEASKKKGGLI